MENTSYANTPSTSSYVPEKTAEPDMSPQPEYKLLIDENVVEKISALSTQKVNGIIEMKGNVFTMIQEGLGGNNRTKGVNANVIDEKDAHVDLSIVLEYGKSAVDVFEQLKKVISDDVKNMTGLSVMEMTVNVVDVMDQEEFNAKRKNNSDDGDKKAAAEN